jgi:hypothetical protein
MSVVEELVEKIGGLSLLEASELKKALEDKFGVTAAAPMMMAGATGPAPTAAAEEKTEFVRRRAEELRERVQDTWNDIGAATCERLVGSMPSRVAAVLKAKGGYTKY